MKVTIIDKPYSAGWTQQRGKLNTTTFTQEMEWHAMAQAGRWSAVVPRHQTKQGQPQQLPSSSKCPLLAAETTD